MDEMRTAALGILVAMIVISNSSAIICPAIPSIPELLTIRSNLNQRLESMTPRERAEWVLKTPEYGEPPQAAVQGINRGPASQVEYVESDLPPPFYEPDPPKQVSAVIPVAASLFSQGTLDEPVEEPERPVVENWAQTFVTPINSAGGVLTNRLQLNDAYTRYQIQALDHRIATFGWQLLSTKISFFIVILIVLSGITFSGMQFATAWAFARRATQPKAKNQAAALPAEPVTTLKANWQGIEVSSSIMGVLTLMISLLFFALYLKFIYPITEVGVSAPVEAAAKK